MKIMLHVAVVLLLVVVEIAVISHKRCTMCHKACSHYPTFVNLKILLTVEALQTRTC